MQDVSTLLSAVSTLRCVSIPQLNAGALTRSDLGAFVSSYLSTPPAAKDAAAHVPVLREINALMYNMSCHNETALDLAHKVRVSETA